MKLDTIGFYTLSDVRAAGASGCSPMWRCELIVTTRCSFACSYCRGPSALPQDCRADLELDDAMGTIALWINDGLRHIRFSGGEPTLYPHLETLVAECRRNNVERIALSTNGASDLAVYERLLSAGVDDWSISLDACCALKGDTISSVPGSWDKVTAAIRFLAARSYVTLGVVITPYNVADSTAIIQFAHDLGVADIRLVSAAQHDQLIPGLEAVSDKVLATHPILRYRVNNCLAGRGVRGIELYDSHQCWLALDDSVVAGQKHFPCVIYMREGGNAIGRVGPNMRADRLQWVAAHDTHSDAICSRNCLDVCVDYNNRYASLHGARSHGGEACPTASLSGPS